MALTTASASGWSWACPHCEHVTPRVNAIIRAQEDRAQHLKQHRPAPTR